MAEDDFLSLTAEQQRELDDRVDRFENAWFANAKPGIEAYLCDESVLRRALLAELILVEVELRTKAGETGSVESYLIRFPELAADSTLLDYVRNAIQPR